MAVEKNNTIYEQTIFNKGLAMRTGLFLCQKRLVPWDIWDKLITQNNF